MDVNISLGKGFQSGGVYLVTAEGKAELPDPSFNMNSSNLVLEHFCLLFSMSTFLSNITIYLTT